MMLRQLINAVEAGTATAYDCGLLFPLATNFEHTNAWDAYRGSLDAAKRLHDALLPGSFWYIGHLDAPSLGYCATVSSGHFADSPSWRGFNIDPARAWLLAILRAMEAEKPE